MSRQVRRRWELRGDLVARSPLHVGTVRGQALLIQARDGLDRPVLPGTSLAGAIRTALGDGGGPLWGRLSGRTPTGSDDGTGTASWVSVDDAVASADTVAQARENVSIDRHTGTAARGHLFTREVVPTGTRFAFRMAVDDDRPAGDSPAADLVHRVADLLAGGRFAVGAATTRGLGLVRLEKATLVGHDLGTRAGMLAFLRGASTNVPLGDPRPVVRPGVVRVTVPWRADGPVMSQVACDGDAVDAVPRTSVTGDGAVRLVLPGSSLKGTLRSHAERIVRTVTDGSAPATFLEQMKADGLGPVGALFGTAGDRRGRAVRGNRGALTVYECHTETALPTELWNNVRLLQRRITDNTPAADEQRAAQAALHRAVCDLNAATDGLRFVIAPHVAVDRWTGGAADSLLFAVLEPHPTTDTTWEPMALDIDTARLGDHADTALMLLVLVLRDLCDGWIAVGHGATRGMGTVHVDPDGVTFEAAGGAWAGLSGRTLTQVLADAVTLRDATAAWTALCTPGEAS